MAPDRLAQDAIKAAARFEGILHKLQVEKMALAHVAQWLHSQDESIPDAAVRGTADAAISYIIRHYC